MTIRNRIPTHWILAAALPVMLAGCHLVLGPEDAYQEWWYYCDGARCYRCNADYCELDWSGCVSDSQCPYDMYCEEESGTCRTKDLSCTVSAECGSDYICSNGKCVPSRGACTDDTSCGSGAYCSDGVCYDTGLCATAADCVEFGSNYECDERGTCVPGPPYLSCTSGSNCPDNFCVDAMCGACSGDCGGGQTCQFAAHCGPDRACLDGRCTATCTTDESCGTGQVCVGGVCVGQVGTCVKNDECGPGEVCVNNTCHPDCTASGTCSSSADLCSPAIAVADSSVKVCIPDTSAVLECQVNKDCAGGELCVNGICRTSCLTNDDCAACDDGPVCGAGGFCMTSVEANPECSIDADCAANLVCLNAGCVTL